MIDANQGAHLVGSERYADTIKGGQAKIQNNEKRLPLINLREAVNFRARMRLVVATILQE
jgi:hypothetical protein